MGINTHIHLMPKKHPPSKFLTAALLTVVTSSVVVTVAMTNAEGDMSRMVISYSQTSASPYQQPNVPDAPHRNVSSTQRRDEVSKPAVSTVMLNRKIKQHSRTVASVYKRLRASEEKIEILKRTIATMSGDTTGLQDSLLRLQTSRDQLSNQFAKLNADLANMKLQLSGAR